MSFAAKVTRSPVPFDAGRGQDAMALLPLLDPAVAEVLRGAAGCSPYLAGLIAKEAAWLPAVLEDTDTAVADVLREIPELSLDALTPALRQAKGRIALLTALADLGGVWPLEKVTAVLTQFADTAVQATLSALVQAEVTRGKLPPEADPSEAGGMVVLAMGKMGAGELNYSSDIDLICLFDESRYEPVDYHDVRASFIRVTRRMTTILSEVREGGYVFRTDLRLRPDASVTPVCLSMEAAERYYESVGRTWERAAYIKARPCAGDLKAGDRFLEVLRPFVWRKHLDFAAIQDAHDMRLKIRDHKRLHGPVTLEGHNVKLGRGGIREIEFFTQTRQLIAGGRDPSLRVRTTQNGLERLAAAGWVSAPLSETLYDHYCFLREVEHRLQMIGDAQTHDLPNDSGGFARLAAFMGLSEQDLRRDLIRRFDAVHEQTEGFFAPAPVAHVETDWAADVTARWRTYPALRSPRAGEVFDRLAPQILGRLKEAAKPDEALAQFDRFLAGLPAGVQLFSLFEANPSLTHLIVDICATAPALAHYLSRNAGVFDAVIGGAFFAPWPETEALEQELRKVFELAQDYEAGLIAARRWAKEWHFRIGVHFLSGLIDAPESGRQYAQLADAVIRGLWPFVVAEFSRKHGPPPGQGAAIVAMGSLGASRLHAGSDLDLIVIYEADGLDSSEGPRPLATRAYYARLTQAMVTALSAQMAEGRLYEVDMRLRPSGRQGPVATSYSAFCDYQMAEAWTWEHLALTRARPVAGPASLLTAFEEFRQVLLVEKRSGTTIEADVADMRRRLSVAKPNTGDWDVKSGAGFLQDIELCAQMFALRAGLPERQVTAQLRAGREQGVSQQDVAALAQAADVFAAVQAALRLMAGEDGRLDNLGEGGQRVLLEKAGHKSIERLLERLVSCAEGSARVITECLEGGAND